MLSEDLLTGERMIMDKQCYLLLFETNEKTMARKLWKHFGNLPEINFYLFSC